ncbi:MAG: DUF3034 family protein [Hydrogenophaga sp.]|uniref:DUF3034 family protein n=1 Tax=Hydrogenophaga sp. TaxID=1904254 RepID=UPI00271E25EF|nr:DUF3034 family protein [Hydrogenophaga sp.]MDO9146285.1 DUF3034 family protein [Hydrogenophaga sp.]MDO9604704.1 DUF3034 family protein [Hydrogenophaga sp.]MDP3478057.1 DUF3034 family protein [Hydrogenophaga sp.]
MKQLCPTHHRKTPSPTLLALAATTALLAAAPAQADTGKLLLTGGVSSVEGSAGGGLSPWAVIGSQAAEGETGVSAYLSRAVTQDYGLSAAGVAVGINDRVELSFGHQDFNTRATGTALGLPGLHLRQNILGAKVRVAGDAVLDSDSLMPQLAVGIQAKRLQSSGLDGTLAALGAKRDGVDVYLSATKLFLAQGILVNGTLRATKANQNGLLGFGATLGGADNGYQLMPELSVAWLLSKNVAVGFEYRAMPNKLQRAGAAAGLGNGLRADDWMDLFVAWAPSKNLSLTAAYVNLGRIVPATTSGKKQTGVYLSAQVAF